VTLDLQYEITQTIAPGAWSTVSVLPRGSRVSGPDKETMLRATNRVILDGKNVRYDDNLPLPREPEGEFATRMYLTTGSRGVILCVPQQAPGKQHRPWGTVQHQFGDAWFLPAPVSIAFRDTELTWCQTTGARADIGGVFCYELRTKRSAPDSSGVQYWVDPGKGYTVRRRRAANEDGTVSQLEVRYEPNARCGWRPMSWQSRIYAADGHVLSSVSAHVLSARVNETVSPDLFQVRFPPGTLVEDTRSLGGPPRTYEIQADGELPEERPRTESPEPLPPGLLSWSTARLLLGVVVVVAIISVLGRATLRRKRAQRASA
jgi:hypothetical protein